MLLRLNDLSNKCASSTCLSHSHLFVSFDILNNHFEQVFWLICKAPLQQEPSCCPRHTRPTLLFQTLTVYHCCIAIQGLGLSWWFNQWNNFTSDHIPRFVFAAIILTGGILFTVVLFFGQWLFRCLKWKLMKWTTNEKYWFHGCIQCSIHLHMRLNAQWACTPQLTYTIIRTMHMHALWLGHCNFMMIVIN